MQRFGLIGKAIAVVLGVTLAAAALVSAFAQDAPPHRFWGNDATPGDSIAAVVPHGDHYDTIDSTTVGDDGSWYIDVAHSVASEVVFELNGEHAHYESTPSGEDSTQISGIHVDEPAMEEDDSMDDDSMMDDGEDSMMEDDDSMMDDGEDSMMDDGDDSMSDDDDSMMDDGEEMEDDEMLATEPPTTGTGGLADNGGVSAGLIGLLIALGAAAVAGIGVRRVRNRA